MTRSSSVSEVTVTGLPPGGLTPSFAAWLERHPVAGFLLFRRDFPDLASLSDLVQRLRAANRGRPTLFTVDEEGGWVSQLAPDGFHLPSARVLARGATPEETETLAHRLGAELAARGINVNFAPVDDVETEPHNPVIGPRSFGADPETVARYAAAVRRGLTRGGVAPCAKHFPGHGGTTLDSHLALPRLEGSAEHLAATHLPPFERAVRAGVPIVMVAHVVYPALDPSGTPASLSRPVLTGLLRKRLGFEGLVVTDALEMKAVANLAPPDEVAVRALSAGADLLLYGAFTPEVEQAVDGADRALGEGRLDAARLAEARARRDALHAWIERTTRHAEPAPRETPSLTAIAERALRWFDSRGESPAGVAGRRWLVIEPAWKDGASLAEQLTARGWRVEQRAWESLADVQAQNGEAILVACPRRAALESAERAWLARASAASPLWLVAFAQDGFLRDFPQAAGRLSACDPSPAMRGAVVEALAGPSTTGAAGAP